MIAIAKARSFSLFIVALALGVQSYAGNDPLVEKTRSYSKSYSISGNDKVLLSNKFGDMKINTWDKNEVKVEATIKVEAGTDEKAQAILDAISIEDGKNANQVWFKTKVGSHTTNNNNNGWTRGEKQSMSIHYVVFLPGNTKLDATNEFGQLTIGDYAGEVTLSSKFGGLTAGKLSNPQKVKVEFGKATFQSINNGNISVHFSNAVVNKVDGSFKGNFEHSGVKVVVDNAIKNLDINSNFTELNLDVNVNLSANFDINTGMNSLNNETNFNIKRKGGESNGYAPNLNHQYNGQAGSGSLPIKVRANFGEVTIGHNITFELEKDKNKARPKAPKRKAIRAV